MTVKELSRRCLKIDTKKFDPLLLKFFIHSRFLKKLQTLYENLNYNSWISWLRSILRKKKKHAKLKAFKAVGESRLATLFASCLEKFTQNRLKYLWAPKKSNFHCNGKATYFSRVISAFSITITGNWKWSFFIYLKIVLNRCFLMDAYKCDIERTQQIKIVWFRHNPTAANARKVILLWKHLVNFALRWDNYI